MTFARLAKNLNIPIIASENTQKGQGLIPKLNNELGNETKIFQKNNFSMLSNEELLNNLISLNRNKICLICSYAEKAVFQTCMDLLDKGFEVHLISDSITTSGKLDRKVALHEMEKAGAFISTTKKFGCDLLKSDTHEFYDIFKARFYTYYEGDKFLDFI